MALNRRIRLLGVLFIIAASFAWPHPVLAQDFVFTAESQTIGYDSATGAVSFSIVATLDEDVASGGDASLVQGFSLGLAHDGALLQVVDITPSPALAELNDGGGPFFFFANVAPSDGDGFTVGTVFDSLDVELLTFADPSPMLSADYETVASAFAGNELGFVTQLTWIETLGTPDVVNVVVTGGFSTDPVLVDGTLTFEPAAGLFLRGDAGGDGTVNALIDALYLLGWQFSLGPEPPCDDAADADNNGLVNALIDALFLLSWQFSGGAAPPAPGTTTCGADAGADSLDCSTPPPCS
ncbi:MAG: hypothetical protein L0Z55_09960 [Planctomycetes bacterium]|nr:hypothetical protein [Planctomycetota bacterium]